MSNAERFNPPSEIARRFTIAVVKCGNTTRVSLDGWIVYEDSAKLLDLAVALAMRPLTRAIVIDMRATARMDACALGILASAYKTARSSGIVLTIKNPSQVIREIFRVTGLEKLLLPSVRGAEDAP